MKTEIPKSDAMGRWEFHKYKIRQLSLKYSKEKAAERRSKRISLENRVKQLETKISTSSNEELLEQYNKAKNDLEALYDYTTEGIILRSKTDWYEQEEKSFKYFLNPSLI